MVHKVSAVVLHTALKAVLAIGGSEGVVVVLSTDHVAVVLKYHRLNGMCSCRSF